MNMNICIVAGARPNIIKAAPIIRAIRKAVSMGRNVAYSLVYTGTANDATLEPALFSDLGIDKPDACLGVDCVSLNELVGKVMAEFDKYLGSHPTDAVIVSDDLSSTMGVAIVTKKSGIRLAHLVAGTRSFDLTMPKEINRMVIDGLSDLLFTAGASNSSIANKEGAELSKVYFVGNILMDALRYDQKNFYRPQVMDALGVQDGGYIVFTINRKKLLDDRDNLQKMLDVIGETARTTPVIAPLHTASEEVLKSLSIPQNVHIISPLRYLEFGYVTAHAKGVVTDSGNIAEEATFNGIPCITLNSYVEHTETVTQGTNVLVGEDAGKLRTALADMDGGKWKHSSLPDRWDGRSAERIVQILLQQEDSQK